MEVKIGVLSVPRELVIEVALTREEVEEMLRDAVSGPHSSGVFELADVKGGKVMVPADKIAYVEFSGSEPRRVGFGSL